MEIGENSGKSSTKWGKTFIIVSINTESSLDTGPADRRLERRCLQRCFTVLEVVTKFKFLLTSLLFSRDN